MNFWRSQPSAARFLDRVLTAFQSKVIAKSRDEPDTTSSCASSPKIIFALPARHPWQTSFAGTSAGAISVLSVRRTDTNPSNHPCPPSAAASYRANLCHDVECRARMIYRDEKPPVFVPGGSSPCRIEAPVFMIPCEMKELGLEMVKVHGSRMVARC